MSGIFVEVICKPKCKDPLQAMRGSSPPGYLHSIHFYPDAISMPAASPGASSSVVICVAIFWHLDSGLGLRLNFWESLLFPSIHIISYIGKALSPFAPTSAVTPASASSNFFLGKLLSLPRFSNSVSYFGRGNKRVMLTLDTEYFSM